jgi:hypothetical protein
MGEDESDASHTTGLCGRRSAFANSELAECLASRVSNIHSIKVDATELICRYLTRCADDESAIPVPFVDQSLVRAALNQVTTGPGAPLQPYPLLAETRQAFLTDVERPPRSGLNQVFSAIAMSFSATYDTNLLRHFHTRHLKTFKRLHPAPDGCSKADRRLHALKVCRLVFDVERRSTVPA